jgi:hypothetical protein
MPCIVAGALHTIFFNSLERWDYFSLKGKEI